MPAAAIIGASVIGGVTSVISGNKASNAQVKAQDQAIAEQRRQYDQTRADYAPWRDTGQAALSRLASIYGLWGGPATGTMSPDGTWTQDSDFSSFYASPDYEFRMAEGVKAIDRSAAARGLLNSGAAVKAQQRFGQGLASAEFGNYWNRLAGLAGVGQAATDSTTAAGTNAANNISNAYINQGNARASAYLNTGSAINGTINNVLGGYLSGWGRR